MTKGTHKLQTILPPLFGGGMPLLEGLYLKGIGRGDDNLDVYLTSERFPRLRALVLTRTIAPRDISLYAQLQTLELNFCHHTLSFEGFMDVLAASVQLEELSIYETLSSFSSEDPTRTRGGPVFRGPPTVLLPHLRRFMLMGNGIMRTSRFLAHLRFQPSAVLEISADVPDPADNSPDTVLSFSAMLPPNPSATLPSLAIATAVSMRIQEHECELHYDYPSPIVALPDSTSPDVTLLLELNHSQWGPFMGTALDDLVRSFRRSPLTYLVVQGNHTYGTAAAWERIFRTFPLLEELGIRGLPPSDVGVVFRGLHTASKSTSIRVDGGNALGSVACPNLEYVRAAGIGSLEAYEAVRECFLWRGERGVVVKVLDLSGLRDQGASVSDVRCALVEELQNAVESLQVCTGSWCKQSGGSEEDEVKM
ncbi:hypothetical protein V8D89_000634 [Ganoderma adspersum]